MDILKRKNRLKSVLTALSYALSAGMLGFPHLVEGLGRAGRETREDMEERGQLKAVFNGFEKVPDELVLARVAQRLCQQSGVELCGVYVSVNSASNSLYAACDGDRHNRMNLYMGRGYLTLAQRGSPLVRAVIGHEIAHVLHRDPCRSDQEATTLLYFMLAGSGAILLSGLELMLWAGKATMATGSLWMGTAALAAGGAASAVIHHATKRQQEHLADLVGARLSGEPEALVKFFEIDRDADSRYRSTLPWYKKALQTHPAHEDRIATLTEAFNLTSNGSGQPPLPPAMRRRRGDAPSSHI